LPGVVGPRPHPDADRLLRAAWAHTTRRVLRQQALSIGRQPMAPRAGDLILARIDALGFHRALQLPDGRKRNLFPGDEIVVAYGNRYASNQFEAIVPKTFGPCHLVAGGGVAAKARSWHARISNGPTVITPVGYVLDADDRRVNLTDYAMVALDHPPSPTPVTLAVVGSSMDAGKTGTCAFLVRGITQAGLRVGYAKVTGTGAGGDSWLLNDAGANPVLDFTDVGHVSTYRLPLPELERVLVNLVSHVARTEVDAIVLEIADGVLQQETAALLQSRVFSDLVGGVMLAAGDATGAVACNDWLARHNIPVLGLGGVLTAAPLQRSEAEAATGLPTYTREDLAQAQVARAILAKARRLRLINGGNDAGTGPGREDREQAARA
jgi:hypothetical protein